MKEYRLSSWPQLRAPFDRIAHRRMLSDMSHRYVSVAQLALSSGIRRQDVRQFVDMLGSRGIVLERDASLPVSLFGSLRSLGGWLKRAVASSHTER